MRPDDIHQVLRRQPFQPFRLHLSSGRMYDVRHPELVIVGRNTMIVGQPAPDLPGPTYDNFAIITLLHINNLEPLPLTSPQSKDGPGQ